MCVCLREIWADVSRRTAAATLMLMLLLLMQSEEAAVAAVETLFKMSHAGLPLSQQMNERTNEKKVLNVGSVPHTPHQNEGVKERRQNTNDNDDNDDNNKLKYSTYFDPHQLLPKPMPMSITNELKINQTKQQNED